MVGKNTLEGNPVKKIVVDSGKFATKAVGRDSNGELKTIYFETKMSRTEETKITAEDTYAIEINGERFLIGRIASSQNDFDTTKAKELHKNAIYTAVHQLVNDKDSVSLVVGCPISIYTEKELREEYEEFLKEDLVDITVNEVRKTFKIVSVHALPESSGYIFNNMDKYLGKMVAVVDIGGLNSNCCIYEGVDMLPGTDFTYNLGANVLRSQLKKALNKKFLTNLSDKQTEQAIAQRHIKKNPEKSEEFINEFLLNHVIKLREAMKENQWDIENLDFAFLGGGSLLLKNEIIKVFGDNNVTISENAVWDNAEGFASLINL